MNDMKGLDKYIEAARKEWGRSTPFRLGIIVGRSGVSMACPYPAGTRGARSYRAGLNHAVMSRRNPHHPPMN